MNNTEDYTGTCLNDQQDKHHAHMEREMIDKLCSLLPLLHERVML